VGCTAHLINAGIDTGDILCHRVVPIAGARNITDLRQTVDDAQLDLLADVVAFVAAAGTLPPGIPQHAHDGRQFFRLHPALRSVLERHLAQRASARTSRE
jgi:methionyl-tRNA formyltransferase